MNELVNAVELKDGKAVTTSLKIAEVFGKPHKDVLKAIRELECPEEFSGRNFSPAEYSDAQGKPRPMYFVTRDGFTLLAMGFTGAKAMHFKVSYIEAFNAMERTIKESAVSELHTPEVLMATLCTEMERTIKESAVSELPTPEVLMATLCTEMERRIKAESERDEYRRNLQRIALASGLDYGAISETTGLPKDIVIPTYCRSSKREHAPQSARFIQLILPLREIIHELRIENNA